MKNRYAVLVKTEEGVKISTFKAVRTFMRQSEKYSEEDVKKLRLYPDGVNKPVKNVVQWKTNKYLPEGWTGNFENRRNFKIKSSEGTKFVSLSAAAAFMESDERYTENDVKNVYLCPDGRNRNEKAQLAKWKTSEYLPAGWTCKKVKVDSDVLKIQSDCGSIFTSHFDASVFMNLNPLKYSKEDLKKLNLYPNGKPHLVSPEKSEDHEEDQITEMEEEHDEDMEEELDEDMEEEHNDDEDVEDISDDDTEENLEANDDKFQSVTSSENSSSVDENIEVSEAEDAEKDPEDGDIVEIVMDKNESNEKKSLSDWDTNMYLPEGWLCKENQDPKSSKLFLKSENGTRFRSYKAAAVYMETNREYTPQDIEMLYLYPDGNDHNNEANQSPDNLPNENRQIYQTVETTEAPMLPIEGGWKSSQYLPKGWTCQDKKSLTKTSKIWLKTDTGKRFHYYSPAVAFMREDPKYTETDIIQFYLYPDGKNHNQQTKNDHRWSTSIYLPEGWMCSELYVNSGISICVKADNSTKLLSYKAAAAYMEADSRYTEDDIKKMYCYPDGKNRRQLSQNANFQGAPKEEMKKSKYLPKGWLFRERKKGLDILTSDGTKLESYVAVNRYMLFKQSFTKKEMDLVYLFPDGKNHKTGQN